MSDLEKLQGTWYVDALEIDGIAQPFGTATITVDGTRFTSAGMGDDYVGTVTLSKSKTANTIDLAFTAGPPAGTTNRGIYKLGRDEWTLCLATRGDARPRAFGTKRDTGHVLERLRRRPPEQSTPKPVKPSFVELPDGPASEIDGMWEMESAVFNGAPLAADAVKFCTRYTGGGVTKVLAAGNTMLDASFTLDPKRGHIDYVNRSGKQNGKTQAGIYALNGDVLRICTAAPGKSRPTDFKSVKGDGRSFTEWKRAK